VFTHERALSCGVHTWSRVDPEKIQWRDSSDPWAAGLEFGCCGNLPAADCGLTCLSQSHHCTETHTRSYTTVEFKFKTWLTPVLHNKQSCMQCFCCDAAIDLVCAEKWSKQHLPLISPSLFAK